MSTIHITDDKFEEVVLNSDKPVLVDFWAQWCAPCLMAAPVLEELSNEYEGKVVIAKVDVDSNQQYASTYGISSIPAVMLFVNGELVDSQIGFQNKAKFDALIQKGLSLVKS